MLLIRLSSLQGRERTRRYISSSPIISYICKKNDEEERKKMTFTILNENYIFSLLQQAFGIDTMNFRPSTIRWNLTQIYNRCWPIHHVGLPSIRLRWSISVCHKSIIMSNISGMPIQRTGDGDKFSHVIDVAGNTRSELQPVAVGELFLLDNAIKRNLLIASHFDFNWFVSKHFECI